MEDLSLSTSYRISGNMAQFVKDVMLGRNNIKAHKAAGSPVRYLVGNQYKSAQYIGAEILRLIRSKQINPEDIFILAPSIKARGLSPLRKLENILVENEIPVYLPSDDSAALDDDTANGKVLFSSFHQCKGLERTMVVVFSFDASYFKYYARDADSTFCPCVMYVAATRATRDLYLIAEAKIGDLLPFLRRQRLSELASSPNPSVTIKFMESVVDWTVGRMEESDGDGLVLPLDHVRSLTATTLTKFLPELTMSKAIQLLNPMSLREKHTLIQLSNKVRSCVGGKELVESVSELNGLAIPAMLEVECGEVPKCSMYNQMLAASMIKDEMHPQILERFRVLREPKDMVSPAHFLELAALYHAGASVGSRGFIAKALQLKNFDWMSDQQASDCLSVLREAIGGEVEKQAAQFEYVIHKDVPYVSAKEGTITVSIEGSIDILTPSVLWEIKCVNHIDPSHLLQLGVYAWLWNNVERIGRGDRQFLLLNVLTGEIQEIRGEKIEDFMALLLTHHFRPNNQIDDSEFLREAQSASKLYFPSVFFAESLIILEDQRAITTNLEICSQEIDVSMIIPQPVYFPTPGHGSVDWSSVPLSLSPQDVGKRQLDVEFDLEHNCVGTDRKCRPKF